MKQTLHIETTFKGTSFIPATYWHAAVLDVLPTYNDRLTYSRVDILTAEGKKRFLDLSCSLFGETGVYKNYRLAPIPSLFINGELYFDAIPSRDELEEAIEAILMP
jgi:hypothetical protein